MKSFSQNLKFIKWIILFQALFYLVTSQITELQINEEKSFSITSLEQYKLSINSDTKNYIKIEVQGQNKNNNYVISAYIVPIKTKRIQLAQSFNGVSRLYLPITQIKNGEIFIDLECSNYASCSGIIKSEDYNKIPLTDGEPINYYITDEGTVMEFTLNSNCSISNVWARGQLKIDTELDANNKIRKGNDNYYIANSVMTNVNFKVTGTVGDYINVGFIGYKNDEFEEGHEYYKSSKNIFVDEHTITGYLKKGVLEEVCYSLDLRDNSEEVPSTIYGTGIIFTKVACSYTIYNNGTRAKDNKSIESSLFSQGSHFIILLTSELNEEKICISFPNDNFLQQYDDLQEIVYTYQFTTGGSNENKLHLYEPQLNGVFYPRITNKYSKTAFISHYIPDNNESDSEKKNLNMMELFGLPVMTVITCDNYPLCSLDDETLKEGTSPTNINRFTSYTSSQRIYNDNSPIGKIQTLLVVECKDIEGGEEFDFYCGFNTLISKNQDKIGLIENSYFSQFALKNEEHNFKIKLTGEYNIAGIFIDVINFAGDIEVIPTFPSNIKYDLYRSANKIYISVKMSGSPSVEELTFKVKGLSKSYYIVFFKIVKNNLVEDDSLIKNELQSGVPYLITIDPSKKDVYQMSNKIVTIHNDYNIDFTSMMINFYSLNCKINVGQFYKNEADNLIFYKTKKFDRFSHDYIESSEERYNLDEFEYRISVSESDPSIYTGNLCKVYATAVEINSKHIVNNRDILLPDNIPQIVMFERNLKHVSYGYVHVDFEYDILIKFNLKHTAQYKIRLYYNNKKRENEETIVANDILYISSEEWKDICNDINRPCYIQLDITLEQTKNEENPVLELSIKSIPSNTVTYLPKSLFKIDYLQNDISQYFYTEIGKEEAGFIDVNFLRGSGKIYAKIVQEKQAIEEGANWRGKYVLPSNDKNLVMDSFTKKIYFSTYDIDCKYGCYLLINVFSDIKDKDYELKRNIPFSIYVQSFPVEIDFNKKPIIIAPIDEFIVGTIDPTPSVGTIYELYQILLTSDAEQVVIDFQSDFGGIFINVGEKRPTTSNAQFKFYPIGKDTIYSISKNDILKEAERIYNEKKTNLKDITLTIGIWTNYTDSIITTPYAFIIRLENGDENDIYRVNSDQKALCKTKKMKNKDMYRCVYVIEYDYITEVNSLIIYPNVQNKLAFYNIYGNKINQNDYELNLDNNLKNKIPTQENHEYPNNDSLLDLLYIEKGLPKESYLLISVETDIETIVELMSSYYIGNSEVSANPSTSQLFMVPYNERLTLKFTSNDMVMVNIEGIEGKGEIYWESKANDKYYLKGKDDGLFITSKKDNNENNLIIKSDNELGLFFYVNYVVRNDKQNFDKLTLDRSVNYVYNDIDFPIVYYMPINLCNLQNDEFYDITFSFNILDIKEFDIYSYFEETPFNISASIVDEETFINMKSHPELINISKVIHTGLYDQSLRTGLIRISKKVIDDSGVKSSENPYLLLKIEKNDISTIYNSISIKLGSIKSSPEITVSELSYQFGYLEDNEMQRKYKLKTHNKFKNMNIQFSCLEENLSIEIEGTDNKLSTIEKNKYGKSYYSIENDKNKKYIYLVIKRKNGENNKNREYFMFQYTHSDNNIDLIYSIKNTALIVNKTSTDKNISNYTIDFTPVTDSEKYNIYYILKFAAKPKNIKNNPSKPFIVTQNDLQYVGESTKPTIHNNLNRFIVYNLNQSYDYIQVVAQIFNNERVDYLSYDLFDLSGNTNTSPSSPNNNNNNKNTKSLFSSLALISIIIGGALFISIIIIIIVILCNKKKNEDLSNTVNKISFAESEDNKVDSLLLN